MEKGREAWFKIKKCVRLNNPCTQLEELLNMLINPIFLYSCEIWGIDSKFKDTEPFELLHINLSKRFLEFPT